MIQVVNLGLNNLVSLVRSLEEASGENVDVVSSPAGLKPGNLLVLPGTGSFGEAMNRLHSNDFPEALENWVSRGTGILAGVCLGMQLLGTGSEEARGVSGLSILDSEVRNLNRMASSGDRVPHVGWNEVSRQDTSSFSWTNMKDGTDFYFSHSFHLMVGPTSHAEILETGFGAASFVSAFRKENIVGFQFHPEKSSKAGLEMLSGLVDESKKIG
jgi:imidazole glycerol-phosphate synthase subunit HisH